MAGDGDPRNALLAAIQKGTSLKKVGEAVMKDNKARRHTEPTPSSSGGDLMAALRDRMNMRRKSLLGGAAPKQTEEGGDVQDDPDMAPPGSKPRALTMPVLAEGESSASIGDEGAPPMPLPPKKQSSVAQSMEAALLSHLSQRQDSGSDDEDWESD